MLLTKEPNAEPIAGYRLIEPLGKGGFGEVWKCEAPGGLYKAIKFVESNDLGLEQCPARDELQAIQLIKGLRHPFLLSIERVEIIDGALVIVTELADKNLQQLLLERRAAGLIGLPRPELLRYLREAADVLDLLNLRHGLQHLDIKPANLFLVSDHVKVADFGLVRSLTDLAGANSRVALNAITPRYAAPELFRNSISPTSDQYSLAIVYQELLTGTLPFNGANARQLAMQHTNELPNLAPLPAEEREVLARALAKDPADRFPNCTAFVQSLEALGKPASESGPVLEGTSDSLTEKRADRDTKMMARCPIGSKFLPDYRFVQQLGRTPTAETWVAQTPDGRRKLVKLLYGLGGHDKRRVQEAIERLQAIRHAGLPAREVLPGGPGCLIVVTDLIADCLRDRFQEQRGRGEKGLGRRQLLDWLWAAAETLDELAAAYELQHLGLNPRNLLLEDGRLVIGDFGLLAVLRQPSGQLDAPAQGRYAAPELLAGRLSPHCDQYSLAVIYQEMLTGSHPLRGGRLSAPNLDALAGRERDAVARALSPNPDQRFASCTELLCALEEALPGLRITHPSAHIEAAPATFQPQANAGSANAVVAQLLARAAQELPPPEPPSWLTGPHGEPILQCRFHASLPPQGAEAKFEGFRRQWNAQLTQSSENSLTYYLGMPTRFWQRWFGRPPGLIVDICWARARPPLQPLPQASVRIRANDDGRHGQSLLKEIGPALLDSIQAQLHGHSERRRAERVLWAHPVQASFVMPDGQRSETIEGQGKDISLTGMGLYLPRVLPGARLDLSLQAGEQEPPVSLAGIFVRVQRCGDGWFEAGILFE
jgi:serine/threonine protein kinase